MSNEYKTLEFKSQFEIVDPDSVLAAAGFHSFRRGSIPEPDDDYEGKMTEKERKFMQDHIYITEEQRLEISKAVQGSEQWKKFRGKRITTSKFDSVCCDNPYQSPEECLEEIINPTFTGNQNTEYGNAAEPIAREDFLRGERRILRELVNGALKNHQTYVVYLDRILNLPAKFLQQGYEITDDDLMTIEVRGLIVDSDEPWIGGSSDGEITIFGVYTYAFVEFKCPVRKQIYPIMPRYYYNQCVGNAKIHKREACLFVVWSPEGYSRCIIEYDQTYWQGYLRPKLRHFYFTKMLPRLANPTNQDVKKMFERQAGLQETKQGKKRKAESGAEEKKKTKKKLKGDDDKPKKQSKKQKSKRDDDDEPKKKPKKRKLDGEDKKTEKAKAKKKPTEKQSKKRKVNTGKDEKDS